VRAWRILALVIALAITPGARAGDASDIQAIYRDWMVPRAVELVADSARLTGALQSYCASSSQDSAAALETARRAWSTSLVAWERLSAVSIGLMLDYHMQGKLDFTPTRPRMIVKAVEAAPETAADMDRIGTPAKGFPALEWLLWSKPAQPGTAECRYAVQVAMEIEREAKFMETGFREAAANALDAASAKTAFGDLVNQWVAGLEHLRWGDMEKPARKAATTAPDARPDYPRGASGATAASWAAQWEALRALAEGPGPGSLASMLRERGHGQLAEELANTVGRANTAMAGVRDDKPTGVLAAARELSALKHLIEDKVAPALDVRIGFSDADGD
jgi:predicted lipoprotein